MDTCPHYRLLRKPLHSSTITRERLPPTEITEIPWCAHENSPVTQRQTAVIGGAKLLTCDGDVARCMLTTGD